MPRFRFTCTIFLLVLAIGAPVARADASKDEKPFAAAVPDEDALLEPVDLLDERCLEMQARIQNRVAHGLAELSDHDLLPLAHDIG